MSKREAVCLKCGSRSGPLDARVSWWKCCGTHYPIHVTRKTRERAATSRNRNRAKAPQGPRAQTYEVKGDVLCGTCPECDAQLLVMGDEDWCECECGAVHEILSVDRPAKL